MESINKKSISRAKKAIICLSLNSQFYKDAKDFGLDSDKVFLQRNKYITKSWSVYKNPEAVENDFRWLITIGILRREVDGQGLTSKVRLTPLGRQIIQKFPELANKRALITLKIRQFIYRKLKFK